jgi:outer membrane receptor for ferrienterochelin and colicins
MTFRCAPPILAALLLVCHPAFAATGTITGNVQDVESGSGLFAANVLVTSLADPSIHDGRLTDRSGAFRFDNLPTGRYEIRASYVGYETTVIDAVTVSSGGTARLILELKEEPIEMNKVIISASRKEEKVIDAPASVQVVQGEEIQERATLTPADHLQGRPGIDVQRAGINQGTVVIRGFNNIFSGAALTMVDNRIARVPSLRYNALNLIPTTNEDIDQIEVVSGPGSALYGPNSANGVLHIRTRSPFGSEGGTVSVSGGERDLLMASGRYAGSSNDKVAWKIAAQYYQATDWESTDPVEDAARATAIGAGDADTRIGRRDFDVDKTGVEGRLDVQLDPDATLVLNGGWNNMDAIELTGLGAVQARDWQSAYGQARLRRGNTFVQGYVNTSNSGDTYNLRTGADLVDDSKFYVAQAQQQIPVGDRTNLIVGVDAMFTRPDTKGTINGRNEDSDSIDEVGGYVHAESDLSGKFTFVGALRVDDHNKIADPVFSPRAALVFGPAVGHKFRATYNRAYSTPSTNNLFLDLLASEDLTGVGTATMSDGFDLRAEGVPEGGFTFRRDSGGGIDGLYMTVPDAHTGGAPAFMGTLKAEATQMWPVIVGLLAAQGQDISGLPAPTSSNVGTVLMKLNPTTGSFDATSPSEVQDVGQIKPTITNTFEVGYKGLLGTRLVASADVYYSRIQDFVGPLRVETPNVFFDYQSLAVYLDAFLPTPNATALAQAIAGIPVGTVTPENAADRGDLILTYRNFGDVDLTGADLAVQILLSQEWSTMLSYSLVSDDFFANVEGDLDLALNAPKNKAGVSLHYQDVSQGVTASARVRFVDGFPVESGVYVGEVESYTLVDLTGSWKVLPATTISAVVQNVFDDKHMEFVGVPKIGRLGLLRVTQTF